MKRVCDLLTDDDRRLMQDFVIRLRPHRDEVGAAWLQAWIDHPPSLITNFEAYRAIARYLLESIVYPQFEALARGDFERVYDDQYAANRKAAHLQFRPGAVTIATQRDLHTLSRASQPVLRAWIARLYADEPEIIPQVLLAQERYAAQMAQIISEAYSDEHEAYLEHTNQRLSQALADAERANRAKSEFVAAVSHEIRSPLNAVAGYVRILREELAPHLDAELEHIFDRLDVVVESTHRLTNDLLENARMEAGRLRLAIEAVALPPLLEEIADGARALVGAKPVAIAHSLAVGADVVRADPARLRQILVNFVSNAVKFTDAGRITIAAKPIAASAQVEISVADSGAGIAPADLPHVFDLFYRAEATRAAEGAGIGLFLARQLAAAMGGSLEVESELGHGSRFSARLPRA